MEKIDITKLKSDEIQGCVGASYDIFSCKYSDGSVFDYSSRFSGPKEFHDIVRILEEFCEFETFYPFGIIPVREDLQEYFLFKEAKKSQLELGTCSLALPGKKISLLQSYISIGRSEQCYAFVDDKSVSRKHAYLINKLGTWYICDEYSTNGTRLNGERLYSGKEYPLKDGDEVLLGTTVKIVFCQVVEMDQNTQKTAPCQKNDDSQRDSQQEDLLHALQGGKSQTKKIIDDKYKTPDEIKAKVERKKIWAKVERKKIWTYELKCSKEKFLEIVERIGTLGFSLCEINTNGDEWHNGIVPFQESFRSLDDYFVNGKNVYDHKESESDYPLDWGNTTFGFIDPRYMNVIIILKEWDHETFAAGLCEYDAIVSIYATIVGNNVPDISSLKEQIQSVNKKSVADLYQKI